MKINQRTMVAVLSGVAGYVDTAGFIALFGMFTAHVTGNLVAVVGVMDSNISADAVARLAMIPVFMGAVAATSAVARAFRRRRLAPLAPLLIGMTMVLAAFCLVGGIAHSFGRSRRGPELLVIAAIGTAAMAVQNTVMRDVLRKHAPTTLMTGNLTSFTIHLMDLIVAARVRDQAARGQARRQMMECGVPLAGFVSGALMSGCLTNVVGLWSVAVPTVTTGLLAAAISRPGTLPVRTGTHVHLALEAPEVTIESAPLASV